MKPAICTQCGGQIEVDETKEAGICPHCGTAYITEKVINNYTTNYSTVHNVTENVTKIIYGQEKDEADDFYKRGLTHLKLNEWYKAETNFKKAVELSPEKAIYRFYVLVAQTDNFTSNYKLFDVDYSNNSTTLISDVKKVIKLLSLEEKTKINSEYGLDFTDEATLIPTLLISLLNTPEDSGSEYDLNSELARKIIFSASKKTAPSLAVTIKTWLDSTEDSSDNDDIREWVDENLPKDKKSAKNPVKDETLIIRYPELLPVQEHKIFILSDSKITGIEVANEKVAAKLTELYTKITVTPNLTWFISQGWKFDVVEIQQGCDVPLAVNLFSHAAKHVVAVPENSVAKTDAVYKNNCIYSTGAFHKKCVKGNSCLGAVMGKAIFYPMKKDAKNKWTVDKENIAKFEEHIIAVFGKDFFKGKKKLKVAPEEQYKKALKINK